ncbi:hypothetical protein BDK51DRAFT_44564 [Blyttiomyces helicus]|uniref:F-box domain-containing protein n=1 Tax=Blyttiomyces helicus TaxID=388810 RepID=A0A4P9W9M6_9FUNG|nr:hypothetical protein BDK51DRAFT_44564 [Blyttiomyces helicus]|eukprot:RKO88183.1 hypothetical protein BDK51DRAFT_44564 [Blyttiomyces helicus]
MSSAIENAESKGSVFYPAMAALPIKVGECGGETKGGVDEARGVCVEGAGNGHVGCHFAEGADCMVGANADGGQNRAQREVKPDMEGGCRNRATNLQVTGLEFPFGADLVDLRAAGATLVVDDIEGVGFLDGACCAPPTPRTTAPTQHRVLFIEPGVQVSPMISGSAKVGCRRARKSECLGGSGGRAAQAWPNKNVIDVPEQRAESRSATNVAERHVNHFYNSVDSLPSDGALHFIIAGSLMMGAERKDQARLIDLVSDGLGSEGITGSPETTPSTQGSFHRDPGGSGVIRHVSTSNSASTRGPPISPTAAATTFWVLGPPGLNELNGLNIKANSQNAGHLLATHASMISPTLLTPRPRLVTDFLRRILHSLPDSQAVRSRCADLRSAALVCRDWEPFASERIWTHVALRSPEALRRFMESSRASMRRSERTALVRTLELRTSDWCTVDVEFALFVPRLRDLWERSSLRRYCPIPRLLFAPGGARNRIPDVNAQLLRGGCRKVTVSISPPWSEASGASSACASARRSPHIHGRTNGFTTFSSGSMELPCFEAESLPNLETFQFYHGYFETLLPSLVKLRPPLRRMRLSEDLWNSEGGLGNLVRACPSIDHLELVSDINNPEISLPLIEHHRPLTTLSASYAPGVPIFGSSILTARTASTTPFSPASLRPLLVSSPGPARLPGRIAFIADLKRGCPNLRCVHLNVVDIPFFSGAGPDWGSGVSIFGRVLETPPHSCRRFL